MLVQAASPHTSQYTAAPGLPQSLPAVNRSLVKHSLTDQCTLHAFKLVSAHEAHAIVLRLEVDGDHHLLELGSALG